MGPPNPRSTHYKMSQIQEKMKNRFPFSTQKAFEQGLKKFTPIAPETGFLDQLTDGRIFGNIGYTEERSDNTPPEGSVEFKRKGQNFDITFKNPGKYLEDLYLAYEKETLENKETGDFGTYITKDLTRRISGKLNIDPKKHNAYISQITASITQQENKLISDLQEAATKDNEVQASITSDWGTGKIKFSHKQENPQGRKTRNTRELTARQNIDGIDFSGKVRYGPGTDSRSFIGKVSKDGTELGYKHNRRGRTIDRKFSGKTRLGNVDVSGSYGVDTDNKSRDYEGELAHEKSGVRFGAGHSFTDSMKTLRFSLAKKLGLFGTDHEVSLDWERHKDRFTGDSTQTFMGSVDGSFGDKNPLTYGVEGHYTPKTRTEKKDYGVSARLGYRFDKGGFVEEPVEQQLASIEHDPKSKIDIFSNLETGIGTWALKPLLDMGVNEEELRKVLKGETTSSKPLSYRLQEQNKKGSSATGLFQFTERTANWLGTSTKKIAKMSLPEQVLLYKKYLEKWGWKPGIPLAMMQAAPSYAKKPDNFVVYTKEKNPEKYKKNLVWVPLDKNGKRIKDAPITVKSIKDYYKRQK